LIRFIFCGAVAALSVLEFYLQEQEVEVREGEGEEEKRGEFGVMTEAQVERVRKEGKRNLVPLISATSLLLLILKILIISRLEESLNKAPNANGEKGAHLPKIASILLHLTN